MLIIVVFGASKAIVTLPKVHNHKSPIPTPTQQAVLAAIVVIALKDLILTIFRSIRLIHLSVVDFVGTKHPPLVNHWIAAHILCDFLRCDNCECKLWSNHRNIICSDDCSLSISMVITIEETWQEKRSSGQKVHVLEGYQEPRTLKDSDSIGKLRRSMVCRENHQIWNTYSLGMRVFRFDAPIYFGNAELFLRALYQAVGVDPVEVWPS